jgi:hypothetical protein
VSILPEKKGNGLFKHVEYEVKNFIFVFRVLRCFFKIFRDSFKSLEFIQNIFKLDTCHAHKLNNLPVVFKWSKNYAKT